MNLTLTTSVVPVSDHITTDSYWPSTWRTLPPLQSSCCCSAKPLYQAVIPPSRQVPEAVEIFLCAHHCHRSQSALRRIGGAIYDADGNLFKRIA